jgi:hypothetical protein
VCYPLNFGYVMLYDKMLPFNKLRGQVGSKLKIYFLQDIYVSQWKKAITAHPRCYTFCLQIQLVYEENYYTVEFLNK